MIVDKLIDRILELKNPTVVGLDPAYEFLPAYLQQDADKFGKGATHGSMSYAYFEFNKRIIDAVCDIVPAVKPQVAMYERLGAQGMQLYSDTIRYAKRRGMIVIGDVKRGDIGNTAGSYSLAHLGRGTLGGTQSMPHPVFDSDFITISPYLGTDSVEPFLQDCGQQDKGVFILVKTSNKGSMDIQDLVLEDGRTVYEAVGDKVEEWGLSPHCITTQNPSRGKYGFSRVGAVVGATFPAQLQGLRARMPNTFFLIPGYGAQGGTAQDIASAFVRRDGELVGGIVNSSRGIINAHNSERYKGMEFMQAVRQAALDMREDLHEGLRANCPPY